MTLGKDASFLPAIKIAKSKPSVTARSPKLPGLIKKIAADDIDAAILAAGAGAPLSEIETHLFYYYHLLADIKRVKVGEPSLLLQTMNSAAKKWGSPGLTAEKETLDRFNRYNQEYADQKASELSQIFMRAVNDGDSKKIFEIGKAIESLYALAQKGAHPDSYRREILEIKKRLDQRGEKWSVRQVAEFIGWPDMSGTDGFKQVRNMCDELKFPLTKLRQKADKAKLPD